jgi:hypothetical protein
VPAPFVLFQHSLGIPIRAIKEEEEINVVQIVKKEVKPSLLTDDTMVYVKAPKTTPKNS